MPVTNRYLSDAAAALAVAIRNRWAGWHAVAVDGDTISVRYDAQFRPALAVNASYSGYPVSLRPEARPTHVPA